MLRSFTSPLRSTIRDQVRVDPAVVSQRLGHSSVRITADTYAHMIHGQDDEAVQKWEKYQVIRSLHLYPLTFPVAELAGTLKRVHAKRGVTLSLARVLIAAVAIQNELTLITDNIRDFPMKELFLYPLTN